jgi:hypothetical protein
MAPADAARSERRDFIEQKATVCVGKILVFRQEAGVLTHPQSAMQ